MVVQAVTTLKLGVENMVKHCIEVHITAEDDPIQVIHIILFPTLNEMN